MTQLENERDAARREAAQAQQRALNDERQLAVDERALAGVRERDSFNRDVSAKLDKMESEIRSVQAHLVRASAAERAKVERALHDLAARREYIERDLLRSRDVSESDWRNYALGIDSRVDAMELELRSLEAGR